VIDPAVLLGEISSLRARGIDPGRRLHVSDRAHLILPYHRREDQLAEGAAGDEDRLGTTARGIGPCYSDKMSRRFGLRICDLQRPDRLRERIKAIVAHKNAYFAAVYDVRAPLDARAIADEYIEFARELSPYVRDTALLLNQLLGEGKRVLFEGAQGTLLDVDYGTYPFVTSSNAGPGGVGGSAGVPPRTVQRVLGVVKAYATRVGGGPFPTEQDNEIGERIRERGNEFGTTTGRPRRCGWFDAVAVRYAAMVTGADGLAVMHLDTIAGMESLNICVGYRRAGKAVNGLPADAYDYQDIEPIYETLPAWDEDLRDCRKLADLPATARSYLDRLSECVGVPVAVVSVGPGREQTIHV
jgi:adenylosuccinate synthase